MVAMVVAVTGMGTTAPAGGTMPCRDGPHPRGPLPDRRCRPPAGGSGGHGAGGALLSWPDGGHQPPVRRLRGRHRLPQPGGTTPHGRTVSGTLGSGQAPGSVVFQALSLGNPPPCGGTGCRGRTGAIPRGPAAPSTGGSITPWYRCPWRMPRPMRPGPAPPCPARPSGNSPPGAGCGIGCSAGATAGAPTRWPGKGNFPSTTYN